MRELLFSAVGAEAAVARQNVIESDDDFGFHGAGRQGQRNVVECAFHVECGSQRRFTHPQYTEAAVVRKDGAAASLVDVLGRQADTDNGELLPAAVDDCAERVTELEIVGRRERLAGDDFIRPLRIDVAAPREIKVVNHGCTPFRNCHQSTGGRLVQARNIESDAHYHAGAHAGHAFHLCNLPCKTQRCALELREHIGEAVALIVLSLCNAQ